MEGVADLPGSMEGIADLPGSMEGIAMHMHVFLAFYFAQRPHFRGFLGQYCKNGKQKLLEQTVQTQT